MGKNVFLTSIIVILVVADVANAAFFWNVRKLTAPSPKEDPKATVSPIPSPVAIEKQLNPDGDGGKMGKEKQDQQLTPPSTSGVEKGKGKGKEKEKEKDKSKDDKQVKNPTGSIPPIAAKDSKTPPKEEEVKEKKPDLPTGGNESCDGIERRCQDTKSMIACVKSSDDALKALVLVIMNEGDSGLKVDLKFPSMYNQKVDILKHQSRKVDIPLATGVSNEITLNAGNGDCILHLGAPTLQGNFFKWVPSYSKFMTPIYGAYLLLITTFIAGSIWACCWFGRRKRQSDIPYQELEMSVPETAAVAVDTAEGWDQDWDDDWDEEKAVRSPGGPNISANGLTSRTTKKDGWEDWDD